MRGAEECADPMGDLNLVTTSPQQGTFEDAAAGIAMPSPSSPRPASLSSPWPATEQKTTVLSVATRAPPCSGPRRFRWPVQPCCARVRLPRSPEWHAARRTWPALTRCTHFICGAPGRSSRRSRRRGCVASGGRETEACGCGSGVWQRCCGKWERKAATVRAVLHGRREATMRAVLHGRRAATPRGMPQCMDQFGPYLGDAECHWYLSKSITKSTRRIGTMAV